MNEWWIAVAEYRGHYMTPTQTMHYHYVYIYIYAYIISYTLPKFNIAPEKWWLEDVISFGLPIFRGYVKISGVYK